MPSRPSRSVFLLLAVVLLGSGCGLLARCAWVDVKAMLARRLIEHAFTAHLEDGGAHRPWSWADVHPIAALRVERLDQHRYVLTGASGTSLAFGVGHVDGTARPGEAGHCVLAGHRDTQFTFLRDLRLGDAIVLETHGATRRYVVESLGVVAETRTDVLDENGEDRLTLITCYPFDGLVGSRWRYVVGCRLETSRVVAARRAS